MTARNLILTQVVKPMQRTVFFSGRRFYLTRESAYRDAARLRLSKVCECSRGTHEEPSETCWYHAEERYDKIIRRLMRFYKAHDKRVATMNGEF